MTAMGRAQVERRGTQEGQPWRVLAALAAGGVPLLAALAYVLDLYVDSGPGLWQLEAPIAGAGPAIGGLLFAAIAPSHLFRAWLPAAGGAALFGSAFVIGAGNGIACHQASPVELLLVSGALGALVLAGAAGGVALVGAWRRLTARSGHGAGGTTVRSPNEDMVG